MVSLFHQQKSGEMTKMDQKIANLEGKLIVSCQALPEEPLHSSFIMGRMAWQQNRRSMRDTGKYQRGYQGDTVAGGSSGHRDREEGLCGQ